ncbi:peptidyl-prolyl cis-trans isomerase [uncultured Winogradskyella sp.]|uniref:peptidyl-prolyl cis-trans isomerase n=1 Tax=uncultured Winogradskyella sp. TaxID=395353 RepID=UPI0023045344|nr:peptidyl-prolyl cis-trans isomerase [Winogradskyella sp.]MDA8874485.1 peptidyl-prolyl cis-trans isomerase [Winogradskyella sp.]
MKTKILYIILLAVIIYGCDRFNYDKIDDAVARVNDSYLHKEDLKYITPNNVSKADSTLLANNYINNWASNLLLMDKALLNLPEKQQESFNSLVKQYENDLYTKAYLEALVKRSIDTTVSKAEADTIYQRNKESFKLNDELLKLRYINLPQNAVNLEGIKSKFKKFEKNDKVFLDSIAVQFRSYSLNDSVWVRASQVIEKIPVANQSNKNQLLKKSNFVQLKDSLNLYLIQINDVLLRGDYAPLDYVKPTVIQIINNKRKLELIKEIENEITKDAIKNKQFEIYK